MGIHNNAFVGASGQGGGYNLTKSLRFRSSASAYLNRTPASAGNQKTWTYSTWLKRGAVGAEGTIISGGATTGRLCVFFNSSGQLVSDVGGTGTFDQSTAVYRDPSAWYHFVWAFDTTQATAANRSRMYINGVEVSLTQVRTFTQNADYQINNSVLQTLGTFSNSIGGYNFDGYMTECNFIDGQALTPSSFGETSTTTGVWIPKKYSGSYGTNGFYLPFTDTTSTSTLGTDFSGNSNTWTVNNISLTSGSTYDSMNDVPTLTSATAGNYATFNPLIPPPTSTVSATYSNGNLTATCSSAGSDSVCWATMGIPSSGLWYWEVTTSSQNTPAMIGIAENNGKRPVGGSDAAVRGVYSGGGQTLSAAYNGSLGTNYSPGFQNTTVGVALDMTNGAIYISVNGAYLNSGVPTSGASKTGAIFTDILSALPATGWIPSNYAYNGTVLNGNYGQRPFSYTPPTGFVALNTFNLPTPTIGATASTTANKYFDATLYTGNGSAATDVQTITNSGSFQPDLVWTKSRSNAVSHHIGDSVRGIDKTLFSNSTSAEGTYTYDIHAFNSNGFTVGNDGTQNTSGYTYVAWQWRASNATAVTNTDGSITSTVSANPTAGFSIVAYTGNGTNGATVGHGLGAKPFLIIEKGRTSTLAWSVQGCGELWTPVTSNLFLSGTNSLNANGAVAAPTSTVYTPSAVAYANESGITNIAYCFAPVAGYSAMGSYVGNGSSDGPFVFTGFRPRFILIKESTPNARGWRIFDTARNTYNQSGLTLSPNSSDAEDNGSNLYNQMDILSNGFKLRAGTNSEPTNESGATYIYMAFAEYPFKYSLAR